MTANQTFTYVFCRCCCFQLVLEFVVEFCRAQLLLLYRANSPCSHVIPHEWLAFYSAFLNIHRSGELTALICLVPHKTFAVSVHCVCTIQTCTCHFMQSHIHKVHACLAVTSHMHFWQNDWDLLPATVVIRGWNRYQNKSQRRKLTWEKKTFLPLLQGFEPMTFQSRVWRSNHWAMLFCSKLQH